MVRGKMFAVRIAEAGALLAVGSTALMAAYGCGDAAYALGSLLGLR
jgi:hypothetical protein